MVLNTRTSAKVIRRGLMTAARLKAFDVESVVLERNTKIGDNWTNRHDSLSFHVPTSNCELPYMSKYRTIIDTVDTV